MQRFNKSEWHQMGGVLKDVFGNGRSIVLATTVAVVTFLTIVWRGNYGLIWQIVTSGSLPTTSKLNILGRLASSIATNFTAFSAASSIAIAVLLGANVALPYGKFRSVRAYATTSGTAASFGGVVSGMFGVGCAACGSLAFGPVFSFLGMGTALSLLPFGGEEFSLIGVGLLSWALVLSLRKLSRDATCELPVEPKSLAQLGMGS